MVFPLELLTGFEPVTSSLPRTCSTCWAIAAKSSIYKRSFSSSQPVHYIKFYYVCQLNFTIKIKKLKGNRGVPSEIQRERIFKVIHGQLAYFTCQIPINMLNFKLLLTFAVVMKLADVTDSKSVVREDVPVRVRPAAPKHAKGAKCALFACFDITSVCALLPALKRCNRQTILWILVSFSGTKYSTSLNWTIERWYQF